MRTTPSISRLMHVGDFWEKVRPFVKAILLTDGTWSPVKEHSLCQVGIGTDGAPEQLVWQTDGGSWITCRIATVQAVALKKAFRPFPVS